MPILVMDTQWCDGPSSAGVLWCLVACMMMLALRTSQNAPMALPFPFPLFNFFNWLLAASFYIQWPSDCTGTNPIQFPPRFCRNNPWLFLVYPFILSFFFYFFIFFFSLTRCIVWSILTSPIIVNRPIPLLSSIAPSLYGDLWPGLSNNTPRSSFN